jgi:GDP-4-dehydro-6-deoxy-D-mannose reductase
VRALVTGASGFVGGYLLAHLEAEGDDPIGLDRDDGLDITDRDSVAKIFAAHAPEVVYHLAALSHVGESWGSPQLVMETNVVGTLNVLDAARAAGVGRVLVVGSAEEYGLVDGAHGPIDEATPLRPFTPYGASKVAAGFLALQAFLGSGLETIRVRAFNHTGPGQVPRFVVPALALRIAETERAGGDHIAVGNLDPVREVNDVRDIVRAYRLLVLHGVAGDVYNVCGGVGVAVREVAHRLLALAQRPLELRVDPALARPADVPVLVGNPSKLVAATGWQPRHTLDDTLTDMLTAARTALAEHQRTSQPPNGEESDERRSNAAQE